MKPQPNKLLQTVAGKVIAAVLVVSTGVGAAAAAGADIPMTPSASSDQMSEFAEQRRDSDRGAERPDRPAATDDGDDGEVDDEEAVLSVDDDAVVAVVDADDDQDGESVVTHGAVVSEFTQTTDLTGCEKGQATAAVARRDVDPTVDDLDAALAPFLERCADADDAEDEVADDEDVDTHGAVVSEFTQTTDLTGCEKGQATAAVARRDVDPAADDLDAALAPFLERCADDESAESDDVDESTVDEQGDETSDETSTPKGPPEHANGKAGDKGKSGSAGNNSNSGGNGRGNAKP